MTRKLLVISGVLGLAAAGAGLYLHLPSMTTALTGAYLAVLAGLAGWIGSRRNRFGADGLIYACAATLVAGPALGLAAALAAMSGLGKMERKGEPFERALGDAALLISSVALAGLVGQMVPAGSSLLPVQMLAVGAALLAVWHIGGTVLVAAREAVAPVVAIRSRIAVAGTAGAAVAYALGYFVAGQLNGTAGYLLAPLLLAYVATVSVMRRNQEERGEALTHTIELAAQALNARDDYTQEHSRRTAELSAELAKRMGLVPQEVQAVEQAARLHDLGKIALPDGILAKPDRLTFEEWEQVAAHPSVGADIVSQHAELEHLAPIIRHHHEHFNGTGYPDGLRADEIPLGARIVAVAEVFDAIANPTPYRKSAMATEDAVRWIMQRSRRFYDPEVVAALQQIYGTPSRVASEPPEEETEELRGGPTPVNLELAPTPSWEGGDQTAPEQPAS